MLQVDHPRGGIKDLSCRPQRQRAAMCGGVVNYEVVIRYSSHRKIRCWCGAARFEVTARDDVGLQPAGYLGRLVEVLVEVSTWLGNQHTGGFAQTA